MKDLSPKRFCLINVVISHTPEDNMANLEELSAKLHEHPGVKVNWAIEPQAFANKKPLIKKILEYRKRFGDEVTANPIAPCLNHKQKEIFAQIDWCMAVLKKYLGEYPKVFNPWHLNSSSLEYLHKKYRVEISVGQMWEQLGIDGFSGVGSINGPYYPSKGHSLVPAHGQDDRIDIIMLDTIGSDLHDTYPRIPPRTTRTTIHPWDANVVAGDGVEEQKFIARTYLDTNYKNNPFALLNIRFELNWMNKTDHCFNVNQQMKKRQFAFMEWLYKTYPDIHYATLSEFNAFFRKRFKADNSLVYRYYQEAKYEPNSFIYWYFNKDYRFAVEWRTASNKQADTIVLTSADFRKKRQAFVVHPVPSWYDGYDSADYTHAGFPETKVRSTYFLNALDRTGFTARGGYYDVWVLSDGTGASDIEVIVDGKSLGIASGTRGQDDWCQVKGITLDRGKHVLDLYCRYNPKGEWFAVYAEVILTTQKDYHPPRGRIIEKQNFIATTDFTSYSNAIREPNPPSFDWNVKNGTSWKITSPMNEIFYSKKNCLNLSNPQDDCEKTYISRSWGGHPYKKKVPEIPFFAKLVGLREKKETTVLEWRVYNHSGELLRKKITLTPTEVIYNYSYLKGFTRLILSDAYGKEHIFSPSPREVVFKEGKIIRNG